MKSEHSFSDIVELIYDMPLEEREELKTLLEHNISDSRRSEIADSAKAAQKEEKAGKLKFSSSIKELKKKL